MLPNFVKIRAAASSAGKQEDGALPAAGPEVFKLPVAAAAARAVDQSSEASTTQPDEISVLSDDVVAQSFRVHDWDKKSGYSDYIRSELAEMNRDTRNVIMLFESPSSSNPESRFYNSQVFKFHLSPSAPTAPTTLKSAKSLLGPLRYSLFNGTAFPTYNRYGDPPAALLEHWARAVPGFARPSFVAEVPADAQVYAYLPCESLKRHINDPHVHYHLAGKDALHLMTRRTTGLLPNTKVQRPCVAKTTHSMASKGIFVIQDDADEAEFEEYIRESGKPNFVVTEFVEIARNAACHFFIHTNGDVTWFGSNENHRDADGNWSLDSYLLMKDQAVLKEMQLPYVKDIAEYCQSLGFVGFCGIDVLFDPQGNGFVVDVNPRVTGSCPALMVAQLFQDVHGFECGLFRRTGDICFHGSEAQLFEQVESFNDENEGVCKVVIFASCPVTEVLTKINIGVYGHSIDECRVILNRFAQPKSA